MIERKKYFGGEILYGAAALRAAKPKSKVAERWNFIVEWSGGVTG